MTTAADLPAPAGRARWVRLIPVAIIVYVISFMDRTNIAFAFSGMGHDLHISETKQGLAGDIHRLPLPADSGRVSRGAVERDEVRRDHNPDLGCPRPRLRSRAQLHPTADRPIPARRGGGRHLAGHPGPHQPLVPGAGAGPGLRLLDDEHRHLLDHHRAALRLDLVVQRLATLFFVEGAFPFLIAAPLWWLLIADRPAQAGWVDDAERTYIETSLARENAAAPEFTAGAACSAAASRGGWSWCTSSFRSASTD
jgi:hypothetical protein